MEILRQENFTVRGRSLNYEKEIHNFA